MSSNSWRCEVLIPQYNLPSVHHSNSFNPLIILGTRKRTHLLDDPPPLSQVCSPTWSLSRYTPFRLASRKSSADWIKVNRWHIEGIDNCKVGFDIDFRRIRSLCIVVCLSSDLSACPSTELGEERALHQVVRFRTPVSDLSRILVKMNLALAPPESGIVPSPLRYSLAQNSSPVSHSSSGISFYQSALPVRPILEWHTSVRTCSI